MITIMNLSKDFTKRTLFKDVNLSIYPNEKIGLTGPNGSGKTTLFSMILGEMAPSSGSIQVQKNLQIGFLPQEAKFHSDQTVLDEVSSGDRRVQLLLEEKAVLEEENKADSMRYGDILEELETLGIYEMEHKAEKVLAGLGFNSNDVRRPVNHLSGGWQMRTLLAKLLVYQYDLLLLDEPTNYLDLPATLWLKDFLKSYQGTFVVISHDKIFLNDVTNYTIVLEHGQISKVKGNYDTYEQQKNVDLRSLEKQQKVLEKRKEQLERFTQRFHAQPNRASAVRNKRKMIERLEDQSVDLPQVRKSIKEFEFPETEESGYVVATAQDLSKSYGEKKVYDGLDLELLKGQKVCLVGPNGAGKSTLLKMLAGVITPDKGDVKLGHKVSRGYFSQTRLDVLNPERTVLDELASTTSGTYPAQKMRNLLGLFNFHGDDVFKYVKVLSGGEKSRLILAKLILNPPNFMLLDEPTTHLDIDGVDALTTAFREYRGTLCFISHDLYFIRQIADAIIEVNAGQIRNYPGGLEYYLHKKQLGETMEQSEEEKARQDKKKARDERQQQKSQESEKMALAREKQREAKRRLAQIRNELQQLEQKLGELDNEVYVKSRVLSNSFGKDPELLKEYGKRLKEIPAEQREIAGRIRTLKEEKRAISQ